MKKNNKNKGLEVELGRYKKKVADQQKEIRKLKKQLELEAGVARGLHRAADMLLCHIALKYGERVPVDHNEKEVVARLMLPPYDMEQMEKYQVDAWKDKETGLYIVGVTEKNPESE